MLTELDLSSAIGAYERVVLGSIEKAKSVRLAAPLRIPFSTRGLSEEKILELASLVPTGCKKEDANAEFLYLFSLSRSNMIPPAEILLAFNEARTLQLSSGGRKNLCKPHPQASGGKALYVGRSYSPRERFKQHLRSSESGTYAMHLTTWASAIDIKVDFYLYSYTGVGDMVIQVLEDGLWDHLKPMLGRRGQR